MKMLKTYFKTLKQKGSALIISIMFTTIMGLGAAAVLNYQYSTHKMSHKSYEGNRARYLAEAGIQIALNELNTQDPPFTAASDFTWTEIDIDVFRLIKNDIGEIEITVDYSDPDKALIKSYGLYQTVRKGIKVLAYKAGASPLAPIFPGAIATLSDVIMMNSFEVDSFSGGTYDPDNPGYNGHIFTKSDVINLKSGTIVRGHIYAPDNPAPTFLTGATSNGMVFHSQADEPTPVGTWTTDTTGNNCGGSTGEFSSFKPTAIPPHLLMTDTPSITLATGGSYSSGHYIGNNNLGDFTLSGGFYKIDGDLGLKNGKTLTVSGNCDIFITGDLSLDNNATIVNYTLKADGSDADSDPDVDQVYTLRIFIKGSLAFAQGNEVNLKSDYATTKLQLYGCGAGAFETPADKFELKNSTAFFGFVYAPNYDVEFNNSNEVFGAFAVNSIIPKNGSKIHFDERLWGIIDGIAPDKYGLSGWNEI